MINRQLPGGRGLRKGEDRRVGQSESEGTRLLGVPSERGWVVSPVGDHIWGHVDVTGVLLAQDLLTMWYLPERVGNISFAEARLVVAASAVSSYIETALYQYDGASFTQIPQTFATFDSTATGLKQVSLGGGGIATAETRLFLAVLAHSGAPVVEGYQSGASAAPRLIRQRERSGHTIRLKAEYPLSNIPLVTTAVDTPLVAYLSKEASLVL